MYLDRMPQIGDKIEVTVEPYRTSREVAGTPNKGIVTEVVTLYGFTPLVFFTVGTVEAAINSEFCRVINREVRTLQNGPLLPNPLEKYYGA